eukprot:COSAG05_NODE_1324_length_5186_cov_10.020244_3_plen_134_part_00
MIGSILNPDLETYVLVEQEWPAWTAWYKPLSRSDARRSQMAVLLMNNADEPQHLEFTWSDVPGLAPSLTADVHAEASMGNDDASQQPATAVTSCLVYDAWSRKSLGRAAGARWSSGAPVPAHGSVFLTLAECK